MELSTGRNDETETEYPTEKDPAESDITITQQISNRGEESKEGGCDQNISKSKDLQKNDGDSKLAPPEKKEIVPPVQSENKKDVEEKVDTEE